MADFEMPKSKAEKEKQSTIQIPVTAEADNPVADKEDITKPKYDPAELDKIFDDMIFMGSYSEEIHLRGGKLKIILRTRTAEETEKIGLTIDTTSANLMATLMEKRSLINLHYSLVSYAGKDLSGSKLEERANFVNKLPTPIVGALINALAVFEGKVYAACEEAKKSF